MSCILRNVSYNVTDCELEPSELALISIASVRIRDSVGYLTLAFCSTETPDAIATLFTYRIEPPVRPITPGNRFGRLARAAKFGDSLAEKLRLAAEEVQAPRAGCDRAEVLRVVAAMLPIATSADGVALSPKRTAGQRAPGGEPRRPLSGPPSPMVLVNAKVTGRELQSGQAVSRPRMRSRRPTTAGPTNRSKSVCLCVSMRDQFCCCCCCCNRANRRTAFDRDQRLPRSQFPVQKLTRRASRLNGEP
ncbi:hypothetical protein BIW11_14188 [Tropilaelaps mercedesae]|uniref:Uncharacterized protein n=1 Tax=Tropilaelaps mercedesae TaxID=418985 RepID=A0A1V9WZ54_9ACAR|nr:hypothetical protein BIW11_14188 [Tropilaelaps mercedesae]